MYAAISEKLRHTVLVPEELYTIAAIVSLLATIAGVWSAWRRRVLMRRLVRSLDTKQRQALGLEPPAESGTPASPPAGPQASRACASEGGEDAAQPAAETAAFR